MSKSVHVLITRAQPWHNGHQELAANAFSSSDKLVILLGSVDIARDFRNPFNFIERKELIEAALEEVIASYLNQGIEKQLAILPIRDYPYNNAKWLAEVQEAVKGEISKRDHVYLTGYEQHESSYYLRYFPQWKLNLYPEKHTEVHATDIRHEFFENNKILAKDIPVSTNDFLTKFKYYKNGTIFKNLCEEYKFVKEYQEQFHDLKDVPFLTGDSVVVCCGHVLIIQRKSLPGRNLYALPGGFFKNKDISQIDTAIRELIEKTKLKIPLAVLKGCIRRAEDFTNSYRSLRWRILTKAVYIVLPDEFELPKVKADDDDSKSVFWMPICDILENRDKFFEDHFHILDTMIGL